MKMMGRIAVLLVVLGLCVPSFGEILIYKITDTGTYYSGGEGGWEIDKTPGKGYMVIDIDYAGGTITQAEIISYGRDAGGKWFEQNPLNLELVRVDDGTRIRWVVMEKNVVVDGEVVSGAFHMLAGLARDRNVGTEEKQEAANSLSGYGLQDESNDGQRDIGITKLSATLYPSWTYWANSDQVDEGNQDFGATRQAIADYLIDKGYEENPAMM